MYIYWSQITDAHACHMSENGKLVSELKSLSHANGWCLKTLWQSGSNVSLIVNAAGGITADRSMHVKLKLKVSCQNVKESGRFAV